MPRGRDDRGGRGERGADLRYNMEITLEDAFNGKTAQISLPTSVMCEGCSGFRRQGWHQGQGLRALRWHGQGSRATQGFFTIERTCSGCHGRGQRSESLVRHARAAAA